MADDESTMFQRYRERREWGREENFRACFACAVSAEPLATPHKQIREYFMQSFLDKECTSHQADHTHPRSPHSLIALAPFTTRGCEEEGIWYS